MYTVSDTSMMRIAFLCVLCGALTETFAEGITDVGVIDLNGSDPADIDGTDTNPVHGTVATPRAGSGTTGTGSTTSGTITAGAGAATGTGTDTGTGSSTSDTGTSVGATSGNTTHTQDSEWDTPDGINSDAPDGPELPPAGSRKSNSQQPNSDNNGTPVQDVVYVSPPSVQTMSEKATTKPSVPTRNWHTLSPTIYPQPFFFTDYYSDPIISRLFYYYLWNEIMDIDFI